MSPPRPATRRVRMTGAQRREQLIDVSRSIFAEKGFEATSVEEIAAAAEVSKPVVYEHFGGKEGLYAVIVDREVRTMLDGIRSSLTSGRARELLEQAALALLDYVDEHTDGFQILARDSTVGSTSGSFASVLSDIADQVTDILAGEFGRQRLDPETAPLYAHMLVGMVALTGQWWLDVRKPEKTVVAAHLVNLAWNGLRDLEPGPTLVTSVQALETSRKTTQRTATNAESGQTPGVPADERAADQRKDERRAQRRRARRDDRV